MSGVPSIHEEHADRARAWKYRADAIRAAAAAGDHEKAHLLEDELVHDVLTYIGTRDPNSRLGGATLAMVADTLALLAEDRQRWAS